MDCRPHQAGVGSFAQGKLQPLFVEGIKAINPLHPTSMKVVVKSCCRFGQDHQGVLGVDAQSNLTDDFSSCFNDSNISLLKDFCSFKV